MTHKILVLADKDPFLILFLIPRVSFNKEDIQDWGTIENSCKDNFF